MKRYIYKGEEITRRKANLMTLGAAAGMVGAALGLWIVGVFFSALFQALTA